MTMQKNKKFLAFDIGGTKIACSIISEQGELLGPVHKFDTPKTIEGINQLLKSLISSCCNGQAPAMPTASAVQHAARRRVQICPAAASHHPAALCMHSGSYYSSSLHLTFLL